MNQPSSTSFKRWLAVLSLVVGFVLGARAAGVEIGGLYYELNSTNKTATLTYENTSSSNYASLPADVVIPSTVVYNNATYTVTAIANKAFANCTALESISIPNSISTVGTTVQDNYGSSQTSTSRATDLPFYGCTSLKRVKLEDGETSVSLGAIFNNYNLTQDTYVGLGLFCMCPLEEVYLGRNVTYASSSNYLFETRPAHYGYSAFYNQQNLSKVTVGPNVTELHAYVFDNCKNLETLQLGESVKTISKYSFRNCNIKSLVIPNNVASIGNYAFYDNSQLNSAIFGTSLKTIGEYTFSWTNIQNITLPNSVTSLGIYCFANNISLKDFTSSSNCNSLPEGVFKGCTKLSSISLNEGLTTIGNGAFANCSALESIIIPGSVVTLGSTIKDTYGNSTISTSRATDLPFYGCTSLKNVRFNDGTSDISLGAIYNDYNNNVDTYMGMGLFSMCPLEEVYLGRNIVYADAYSYYPYTSRPTHYGYSAFYNQKGLKTVTIGPNVTKLHSYIFDQCQALTSLTLGESVESIPYHAFTYCQVESINLPSSIESVGDYAFAYNTRLSSLSLGNTLHSIGSNAFSSCTALDEIIWNNTISSIGSYAFYNTALTEIELPNTVSSLGEGCFANCEKLVKFELNQKCVNLPYKALSGCKNLNNVILNDGLLTIGNGAFANCSSLESIIIPGTVTSLGNTIKDNYGNSYISTSPTSKSTDLPFYGCTSLKSVRFNDGISDISLGLVFNDYAYTSNYYGLGLFGMCPLEELYLGRNIIYEDAYSYQTFISRPEHYGYSPFYNQPKLAKVTIGEACTKIQDYLFYQNPIITLMNLPNVESIGKAAFRGCSKMTTLNLGNSLETVGDEAFYSCSNITKLTLPETITSIGASAFYNCTSVTEVTVGKSLKSIGASAFYNCPSFTAIILPDGFTTMGASAFEKCTKLTVAKLGESLTSVPAQAFKDCPALSEMVVPASATSIGNQAFYNDSGLATITLKEGLKTIGNEVFWNNSGVMRFTIPGTVTSMGTNCFYGCTKTTYLIFSNGKDELTINNASCRSSKIEALTTNTSYQDRVYDYFYDSPIRFLTLGRNLKYKYSDSSSIYDLSGTSSFTRVTRASAPFVNNTNLISVTIGPDVTYLYDHLFDGCTNIKTVNMGENVQSINTYAFKNCDALAKIAFSSKLETIGNHAFYDCDILGNANFPSSLKTIGNYSFYNCYSLSDVTFAESSSNKLSIGNYAFKDCNGIKELTFPGQLNYLGTGSFSYCTNLTSTVYNNSSVTDNNLVIDNSAFANSTELNNVAFPSHLYQIKDYVFDNCYNIEKLSFPGSLVSIGNYVFRSNNLLSDVTFEGSETLLEVGTGAYDSSYGLFHDCPLETLNLNRWLSYPTASAKGTPFYEIPTLKNITFGNNVKVIDKYMFSYCSGLEDLYLPDNIESVGLWGFRGCSSLKTVRFSEKLSQVSDYGFSECTSLDNVVFPASMTSIADNSFSNCTSLKKLNLGDKLMIIGPSAFKNDTALEGVVLPKSLYGLGVEAFANCTSLPYIKIQGISSVGKQAFQGCSGMKWVSLSEETTSLGENSFAGCSGINYIKSYAEFPPEGLVNFPSEVVSKGTLFVPEYSVDYYQYSPTWEDWYSIRPLNENILVSSIELNNTEVSFKAAQTIQLTATVDEDVTDKTIFWSSDNEAIVTVDATGLITAVAVGEANVTALAADGSGETATCVVTVVPTMVESIAINPGVTSLKKGRTLELTAEVLPATATNSNVAWSSSNASIASVDEDGVVTALTAGNVEIVATAEDGSGVTKTFALTIIPPTKGDSNDNDVVTISDAVNTANYAVGNEVENFNVEAADVNEDNRVTLSDASATIAIVLDQPVLAPSMAKVRALSSATNDESDLLVIDDYSAKIGETKSVFVALDNTLDYVAMQADVTVPEGMTLAAVNIGNRADANHSLAVKRIDDRTMRIALFDINNSVFADNGEAILELIVKVNGSATDRIEINNILASDAQAHEYILTSTGGNNAEMSGIENVGTSNISIETTADGINIYNADGYEVSIYAVDGTTLAHFVASSGFESRKVVPGVYVIAAGNKVEKVMVK